MKKKHLLLLASLLVVAFGCSKDPIITDSDNTKPPVVKPPVVVPPTVDPGKPGDFKIPETQKEYYKTIDFTKNGIQLKEQLAYLTVTKLTKKLSYNNIWDACKATDVTPDGKDVYLIYGHKGVTSGDKAYTRGKNENGGNNGQWNREHTYAQSLGNPPLGQSGPGADAHHLRPADIKWNDARGNLKFAKGSGNSGPVAGGWYPGDDWRGDVARMMMYMYITYNTQCPPSGVAIGDRNGIDPAMINLLLEWNAIDPISDMERKRNDYHSDTNNLAAQGNRNPFIDNPYLATQIWGGTSAENTWK